MTELTPDQLKGRVRVMIDGEDRVLRFDHGALASIVEVLGLEGLAALPNALRIVDPAILHAMVWAGRLHAEPDLTLKEVEEWFYPMMPTFEKVIEGIQLAIWGHPDGDQSEADDDAADPPKREAGMTSEEPKNLQ